MNSFNCSAKIFPKGEKMNTSYSAYYHEPARDSYELPRRSGGMAYVMTNIDTGSSEQLNKFSQFRNEVLKSLDNLVSSASKIEMCPINEGKKSSLTLRIYLGGNPYEENGQYKVREMCPEQIFNLAKEIIGKEIGKN